jgi:hypothetical protein
MSSPIATNNPVSGLPVLDKNNDNGVASDVLLGISSGQDEPLVTQRELWNYYCTLLCTDSLP